MIFAHSSPESIWVNLSHLAGTPDDPDPLVRHLRWRPGWSAATGGRLGSGDIESTDCMMRETGGLLLCCPHVHTTSAQVFQFCTARTTHGWLLIISYPWPLQMRSTQGSSKNDSLDWILDHTKVVGYSIQLLRIPMNLEDQWRPSVQSLLKTRWRLFINALRMSFLDKFTCLI